MPANNISQESLDQQLKGRGWKSAKPGYLNLPLVVSAKNVGGQYGSIVLSVGDSEEMVSDQQKKQILQLFEDVKEMKAYVLQQSQDCSLFNMKNNWTLDQVLGQRLLDRIKPQLKSLGCRIDNIKLGANEANITLKLKRRELGGGLFSFFNVVKTHKLDIGLVLKDVFCLLRQPVDTQDDLIRRFGSENNRAAYNLFNAGNDLQIQADGTISVRQASIESHRLSAGSLEKDDHSNSQTTAEFSF